MTLTYILVVLCALFTVVVDIYNGMFGSSWELALVDNKSVFLIS